MSRVTKEEVVTTIFNIALPSGLNLRITLPPDCSSKDIAFVERMATFAEGLMSVDEGVAAAIAEACARVSDPNPGFRYSPITLETRQTIARRIREGGWKVFYA